MVVMVAEGHARRGGAVGRKGRKVGRMAREAWQMDETIGCGKAFQ
jgi:hypothetical protein